MGLGEGFGVGMLSLVGAGMAPGVGAVEMVRVQEARRRRLMNLYANLGEFTSQYQFVDSILVIMNSPKG